MKMYFEIIPVVAGAIADIATAHKVDAAELETRFLNIMHSELGKVDEKRKETATTKKSSLWAKLETKKGKFTGSQKESKTLFLPNGKTIGTRVVDCYRFSAATVAFEEAYGEGLIGALPPTLENWLNGIAQRLATKVEEPEAEDCVA